MHPDGMLSSSHHRKRRLPKIDGEAVEYANWNTSLTHWSPLGESTVGQYWLKEMWKMWDEYAWKVRHLPNWNQKGEAGSLAMLALQPDAQIQYQSLPSPTICKENVLEKLEDTRNRKENKRRWPLWIRIARGHPSQRVRISLRGGGVVRGNWLPTGSQKTKMGETQSVPEAMKIWERRHYPTSKARASSS